MTENTEQNEPGHTDRQVEQLITGMFAAFRETHQETVQSPGVDAVYGTARAQRRRRAYLSGLSAAAVLVLVAGSIGLLTAVGDTEKAAGDRSEVTNPPKPSPTASPSPPAPSETEHETSAELPPDITDIDLKNVTVKIKPMGESRDCPGGVLSFRHGSSSDSRGCVWQLAQGDTEYETLDSLPGKEVITTIAAGPPQAEYTSAVIAFRATREGRLEMMNYVFIADHFQQVIRGISTDDGQIAVEIEDLSRDTENPQRQTRTYQWAGAVAAFEQIHGPTEFPSPAPEPSDPEPSSSPSEGDGVAHSPA